MPSAATTTGRRRAKGAGLLAAIAVTFALATSTVGAAVIDISAPVTGSINLNGNATSLDGVVLTGTYDDATGDLVGKLVFPTSEINVTSPVAATIVINTTQPADGTGTVDLLTGDATFSANLVLTLSALGINPAEPSPLANCSYLIPLTALTGSLDSGTNILTLAQTGFAITPNPADGAPRCGGLAALIDPQIATSNNSVDASINLSETVAPPTPDPLPDPVEPTPAPTTPAAPRPAAQPAAANPTFTG